MRVLVSSVVMAVLLAGCSSGLLGSATRSVTPQRQVQVGNQLVMPPDLQLKAPTGTSDGYQSNGAPAQPVTTYSAPQTTMASGGLYGGTSAPSNQPVDVYAKYGINKLKPDGTPKSDGELKAELRKAVIAEKQSRNSNYGTIFNMGNIFADE